MEARVVGAETRAEIAEEKVTSSSTIFRLKEASACASLD